MNRLPGGELRRILVIRRDNIGDLVCTTPLIAALRARYPEAWIGALVNSYNASVLEGHPDLDAVYAYEKLKHRRTRGGLFAAALARLRLVRGLRAQKLDCAVIATPAHVARTVTLAALLRPRVIAGFVDVKCPDSRIRLPVPQESTGGLHGGLHEVEAVYRLAPLLGIDAPVPALKVVPAADAIAKARAAVGKAGLAGRMLVGIGLSARRPAQRWPAERYAGLVVALSERFGAACMLFWSPGGEDHPQHPGDDAKAAQVAALVAARGGSSDLLAYPTAELRDLIGALSACDAVVCPDGGAMHLAAALARPVVALFGDSPPERWRPWGTAHEVVRPASHRLADLGVDEVVTAFARLRG